MKKLLWVFLVILIAAFLLFPFLEMNNFMNEQAYKSAYVSAYTMNASYPPTTVCYRSTHANRGFAEGLNSLDKIYSIEPLDFLSHNLDELKCIEKSRLEEIIPLTENADHIPEKLRTKIVQILKKNLCRIKLPDNGAMTRSRE